MFTVPRINSVNLLFSSHALGARLGRFRNYVTAQPMQVTISSVFWIFSCCFIQWILGEIRFDGFYVTTIGTRSKPTDGMFLARVEWKAARNIQRNRGEEKCRVLFETDEVEGILCEISVLPITCDPYRLSIIPRQRAKQNEAPSLSDNAYPRYTDTLCTRLCTELRRNFRILRTQ